MATSKKKKSRKTSEKKIEAVSKSRIIIDAKINESSNYKEVKKVFVDYFISGCSQQNFLGLELEHFVVQKHGSNVIPFFGDCGVQDILYKLQNLYSDSVFSNEYLIGLSRQNIDLTLEPGAQFETSIGKFLSVSKIASEYSKFSREIKPILDSFGLMLLNCGYHPHAKVADIPLLPKVRYHFMDEHFQNLGDLGKCMMRGTAATHVTFDYKDQTDFATKYRVSNFLTPIFAFLFDNSPIFESTKATGMTRAHVWLNTDRQRSCFVPNSFDRDFSFESYADYVLQRCPLFVYDSQNTLQKTDKTVSQIFSEKLPTNEDIAHILSTFFPFTRLKHYLEFRVADSMPINFALGYVALIKALMYNSDNLQTLYNLFDNCNQTDAELAFEVLLKDGFAAIVYNKNITIFLQELWQMAQTALKNDEDNIYLNYLSPLFDVTKKRPIYLF
ncbi:MAG: hypothetical protein LBU60_06710 [Clostridiales bacterium]|nr:hypothetical protein [Clostridiales bacterium]